MDEETVRKVEKVLSASIEWMKKNLEETVQLSSEKLGIPYEILRASLERIGFQYVPSKECKDEVSLFLQKLNELYPEGLQKVPDEGFYRK